MRFAGSRRGRNRNHVLTETTRCHSGGDHDGAATSLELCQHPVTLLLLLVSVNCKCRPAVLSEELGQFVCHALGVREYEHLGVFLADLVEVTNELAALLVFHSDLDDLSNAVVCCEFVGANVDLVAILKEVACERLHVLWPCSREHESLSVGADLSYDLADLRLETHIEHSVSLVKDEVGDTSEVRLAALDHVDETTRGSNDDLGTTRKIADLRALGHTSVNGCCPDPAGRLEAVAFALNLDSQFSGGGEEECYGAIAGCQQRLCVDVNDGRESETYRLTGSRLGDGDKVATHQSHGPSLALDGRGLLKAELADFREDVVGVAGFVEGEDGFGDALALN